MPSLQHVTCLLPVTRPTLQLLSPRPDAVAARSLEIRHWHRTPPTPKTLPWLQSANPRAVVAPKSECGAKATHVAPQPATTTATPIADRTTTPPPLLAPGETEQSPGTTRDQEPQQRWKRHSGPPETAAPRATAVTAQVRPGPDNAAALSTGLDTAESEGQNRGRQQDSDALASSIPATPKITVSAYVETGHRGYLTPPQA